MFMCRRLRLRFYGLCGGTALHALFKSQICCLLLVILVPSFWLVRGARNWTRTPCPGRNLRSYLGTVCLTCPGGLTLLPNCSCGCAFSSHCAVVLYPWARDQRLRVPRPALTVCQLCTWDISKRWTRTGHSVNQFLLSIGFPLWAAAHSLRVALELVQAVGDFRLELQGAPFEPGRFRIFVYCSL